MAQDAKQDRNQFPALIAHTGTAGTAETVRVTADSSGNLGVNIVSGEIVASLGTVNVVESGSIVVTAGTVAPTSYAVYIDGTQTADVTYIGKAPPGSSQGSAVWQIKKIDEAGGTAGDAVITYADGNSNYDNLWTGRATASYS